MANSTIKIIFDNNSLTTMDLLGEDITLIYNNNGVDLYPEEVFVSTRIGFGQSSLTSAGSTDKPQKLSEALLADYPTLFTAIFDSNSVTLTALSNQASFGVSLIPSGLSTEINNNPVAPPSTITVTGLSGDRYLINNEINLTVQSVSTPVYFKTVLQNLSNGLISTNLIAYPDTLLSAQISLQSIVKSLFDYPRDATTTDITKNSNKFSIKIYYNDGVGEILGYSVEKTFVRGGKRTTETNQTLSQTILTPTNKLPYWNGYETAEYYFDVQNLIRKRAFADIDPINLKEMRSKGCNEIYFKFLNQNGGYSNWLFESKTETENNANLGGFIRNNNVDDLGNTADYKLSVQSKVPKEFKQLILDLIVSPEIYANGVRVRSGRNSLSYDEIKRVYNVSINFEQDNRFNPSLLWSN